MRRVAVQIRSENYIGVLQTMYLIDDQDNIVDAECSLALLEGAPCIVVESSGGANPNRGVTRRNPDYNKLLNLIFARLAKSNTRITRLVLDSSKVASVPIGDRIAVLDQPYPVDLSLVDVDEFRRMVGRIIAAMHQDPTAKMGGNAQKRIRICLDQVVQPDQLIRSTKSGRLADLIPDYAPGLNETEREYLSTARMGQGRFRQDLLQMYRETCPITGIANPELLLASHIKPWKACRNIERLDVHNGILLSALFDRMFDRGLITFGENGRLIASPRLSIADRTRCDLGEAIAIRLSEQSLRYMEYHRAFEFKNT